jgi:predicted nucleotidyltransferase
MLTFDEIRSSGLLLYEYIRGSHAYGINRPGSDIDKGGVYMEPLDLMLGLGLGYEEEIHDKKQDVCWNSFGKYMKLLVKSNPSVLESLFIPSRCILYEHPIMKELKKNADIFVTKECFKPFMGYSMEQIKKARSLYQK